MKFYLLIISLFIGIALMGMESKGHSLLKASEGPIVQETLLQARYRLNNECVDFGCMLTGFLLIGAVKHCFVKGENVSAVALLALSALLLLWGSGLRRMVHKRL